jgi:hypothetical protein
VRAASFVTAALRVQAERLIAAYVAPESGRRLNTGIGLSRSAILPDLQVCTRKLANAGNEPAAVFRR